MLGNYTQKSEAIMTNEFGIRSIRDFAKDIGKPASTVYTWKRNNSIPDKCFKVIGGSIFVKVNEMQEFLAS